MVSESIELRVSVLEGEIKDIKSTCKDMNDRLIRMEESLKANKDKIDGFEQHTRAIMEMSTNVRLLTEKVSDMLIKLDKQEKRMDKQDCKINEIEDRPGKAAIKGWVFVATTVGTVVLGVIIGFFRKGGM